MTSVSVVMPVRNEAHTIRRSIESVLAQSLAPTDVIVVDGGSSDGTREILAEYGDRLTVLDNPKGIAASGMNIGIAVAQGSYIARVDGHWWIEPDYLERLVRVLANYNSSCAGGQMRYTWLDDDPMHRAIALATASPLGRDNREEVHPVETVYGAVWPRSTFDLVGMFDEDLVRNQDDELSLRIRKTGGAILCDPRAVLHYRPRSTLSGLFDQYRQYGMWKIPVYRKHPDAVRPRQFALAAWVASLVLGLRFRWMWMPSVGVYLLLIGIAAIRRDRGLAPRIAAAFVARHTGFGIGLWQGIVRLVRP